jgi:hypothetical protein
MRANLVDKYTKNVRLQRIPLRQIKRASLLTQSSVYRASKLTNLLEFADWRKFGCSSDYTAVGECAVGWSMLFSI